VGRSTRRRIPGLGWLLNQQGLTGPICAILLLAFASELFNDAVKLQILDAFVVTAMVVALYVFVGNSGVISLGHVSFVAVGAFTAGLLTLGPQQKSAIFPDLFDVLSRTEVGNLTSLALAGLMGGVFALVIGLPLMRLNGLSAGIATFAVLGIARNVIRNWSAIGPGAKTLPQVPETTGLFQATVGLIVVVTVAWLYQRSPWGRRLRATREDQAASRAVGVSVIRERLIAFTVSGVLAGLAGGLYVHLLGSITTEQVYLDLTFLTLAMLVVGGVGSLWGAVVGGLLISLIDTLLFEFEKGVSMAGLDVSTPRGFRLIALALVMTLFVSMRPDGLVGGREFSWFPRQARTRN
jgi:branched-chain amino acid transport system permease protein